MITNFDKILIPIARYMAILRRNQHVIKTVGGAISFAWLARKRLFLVSGEIETDLSRITTAKIGSLNEPYYSVPSLLERLKKYKSSFTYNVLSLRDSNLAARLNIAIDNLETDVSDGALRKQPFCVMLYGYPGTGKSSFAIQIAKRLMTDLYGEFNTTDMVTLNETDEYQSEFRTSHKVVLFDDIGASKYGLNDTKNPWRKVIDFVNNIKKTALNPNVEMKGKVYIQPDLVILTSNLDFAKGGLINGYIPAFEAILRRLSKIVKVHSHTVVRPLDPHGISVNDHTGGSYLTRRLIYTLRGGETNPIDVPREDYIEELRVAFREHNIDQENFVRKFNSYFDDKPGDPYESTEILQSQSGKMDFGSKDDLFEAHVAYYLKKVDWERFFIEWYELPGEDCLLTTDGIVVTHKERRTDLYICDNAFNEAYRRIRNSSQQDEEVVAESKLIFGKLSDKSPSSDQIPISERLIPYCKDMNDKWSNLSSIRTDQILPFPFYNLFKMTKGASRPKQQSYYIAFAVYICANLGLNASQLFDESAYTQIIPLKYVAKRDKIENKINNKIRQLKTSFPDLFPTPNSGDEESSDLESSLSEISGITDAVQDNESSPDTVTLKSHATPWLDEAEQIKYLLSTVKPAQPCQTIVNAKLHCFGEIDLIFVAPKSILLFECKTGLSSFNKAKHQALRYSRAMAALHPGKRILGMTHTPIGFNMVCDLNASINTEFEGFLRMIGYLGSAVIVEH